MIRKATLNDLESIYQLLNHLEQSTLSRTAFEQIFEKNITDESVFYFVHEFGNHIIGFVSLHIQHLLHHTGKVGEIQELVVKDEWQGKSIGKNLLLIVKETAKAQGCVNLEVTCHQKRLKAHQFYEKVGMKKTHYKFVMNL
jgi:PhnO protein